MMQRPVHADRVQGACHGRIAAAFVDGPFGIGVHLGDVVRLAEGRDGVGRLAPVGHGQ
ncbi:hypothetical protein D3C71_1359640 [compost metagenome]